MTELLATADIIVNGSRPWDIQVHNSKLFKRVLFSGSLGFGEAYIDNWWECEALDQFFFKLVHQRIHHRFGTNLPMLLNGFRSILFNSQSRKNAFEVGVKHYDAGNDLFEQMLDPYMIYSCGYWKDADNLQQAQEAKMALICEKLMLAPGMKLLDIGCGWGGLLGYAARHYGVSAVGLTVSREQAELARQRCAGLPVEVRLQDYREMTGSFDAVVSVGMFEHVGYKNYHTYMRVVRRCLGNEGLFLLHTIGSNDTVISCDPWFDKYIFPNGMLPSIKQIGAAIEQQFIMEDWHNFGVDYDRTLLAWYDNFKAGWQVLKTHYSERFRRMWRYYLLSLAGCFRARFLQVWQVILSPDGKTGGYTPIR